MNELIAALEGMAPTIASALVPGPLSGPVGALAGVAIAHLAEGLGLPHPAEPADIINALSNLTSPAVKDAVLSRAEANFQTTLAPVLPAAPEAAAPAVAPTLADETAKVMSDAGIHNPTAIMVGSLVVMAMSGWLVNKGWISNDMSISVVGALGGVIASASSIYHSIASNVNTAALVSSSRT